MKLECIVYNFIIFIRYAIKKNGQIFPEPKATSMYQVYIFMEWFEYWSSSFAHNTSLYYLLTDKSKFNNLCSHNKFSFTI